MESRALFLEWKSAHLQDLSYFAVRIMSEILVNDIREIDLRNGFPVSHVKYIPLVKTAQVRQVITVLVADAKVLEVR